MQVATTLADAETHGTPGIFPASRRTRDTMALKVSADREKAFHMQQLTVIRAEHDRLIVATESGDTFALPIDDTLRAEVRRARPATEENAAPKASPREIQSHIRAGLTAEETAELLGTTVEDVRRFEAPVVAEREHILSMALTVPVLLTAVDDVDERPSFGDAIRAKLSEANAANERWSSWKEPESWIIKLEFRVGEIDHDARWTFDPKRSALAPQNADATQLSRQGSLPEGLIPRLRALDNAGALKDDSRFDSGAFGPRRDAEPSDAEGRSGSAADAAVKRAPDAPVTSAETADLLEALRRRRGQREAAPEVEDAPDSSAAERGPSPIALFDALEPGFGDDIVETPNESTQAAQADGGQRRRGRAALPSWDEIVFGARGDGD